MYPRFLATGESTSKKAAKGRHAGGAKPHLGESFEESIVGEGVQEEACRDGRGRKRGERQIGAHGQHEDRLQVSV